MNLMNHRESIFEICTVLSEQENLKVTLEEAGKGALMVGVCTFLGGLLGGPVGIAIGKFYNCYCIPNFNVSITIKCNNL